MEENPENSGDRPIRTVLRSNRNEVLVHTYDNNISYKIAHFKMNLEDYLKLEEKQVSEVLHSKERIDQPTNRRIQEYFL